MPDREDPDWPNPREDDIMAGDRRISRPDSSLPDWYVSDAAYRPIPIVWFAAGVLLQTITISVLFFLLSGAHPAWTILACSAATGMIGAWAWNQGLGRSGTGWRIATVVVMVMQLALVCLGAAARF